MCTMGESDMYLLAIVRKQSINTQTCYFTQHRSRFPLFVANSNSESTSKGAGDTNSGFRLNECQHNEFEKNLGNSLEFRHIEQAKGMSVCRTGAVLLPENFILRDTMNLLSARQKRIQVLTRIFPFLRLNSSLMEFSCQRTNPDRDQSGRKMSKR